jgi:outer membrane protein OmpA-like peptidoglycan-associated protein
MRHPKVHGSNKMKSRFALTAGLMLLATGVARSEEPFAKAVGEVNVQPYKPTDVVQLPIITWGGDVVTAYANGGTTTAPDSIYGKFGLKLKIVNGDNFPQQVRDYLEGKSPYLRAELRMLTLASEVAAKNNRKFTVILQETWSAGDWMVGRANFKTLNDLKPKAGKKLKGVLQKNGPHVGMVDDILKSAKATWEDVEIVWAEDLSGTDKSPLAMFQKDKTLDFCCVISPDMVTLTGGPTTVGTKQGEVEGNVEGSHVVIGTPTMSRSLADVMAVDDEYLKAHRPEVEKFIAGYLKATQEVVEGRAAYHKEAKGTEGKNYSNRVLRLAQALYGVDLIKTLEIEAAGLMDDATFVGLEGNIAFFKDKGNLSGFKPKLAGALDLVKGQGYTTDKYGFTAADLDYQALAKLAGLKYTTPSSKPIVAAAEGAPLAATDGLDEGTFLTFSILFDLNETDFDPSQYRAQINDLFDKASLFGKARIVVRGHSDPSNVLREMVLAGKEKGLLKKEMVPDGKGGQKEAYYFKGAALDINNTRAMIASIEGGEFEGGTAHNPRQALATALTLSKQRAEAVRDALIKDAKDRGISLDPKQFEIQGFGIQDPVIPKPKPKGADGLDEVRQNMRVEFRLVKSSGEVDNSKMLDY